ncbi:DUF1349 domain-containing protein [Actinomyces minihominis]|uniref:DUF1349 domain-containing protein n=1 Tax=Actinomyces minihominis TaxID=2002838 RepID=UPI0013ECF3B1|nr:DUF1349 domain-containing protein [Actinomyces minihominis]
MQTSEAFTVPWETGVWTNTPESVRDGALGLSVTASAMSDAWSGPHNYWQATSENALVTKLLPNQAMEVSFIADMTEQYDQAGIFLAVDETTWAKAGMELVKGQLRLTATVTRGQSDRSMCRVSDWNGRLIRVRAAWSDNLMAIYAAVDTDPFKLVRLFPMNEGLTLVAGPYVASPRRGDFTTTFTAWRITGSDLDES